MRRFWWVLPFVGGCGAEYAMDMGSEGGSTSGNAGSAGTLTAGAWDDSRNYDLFEQYLDANAATAGRPEIGREEHAAARDAFAGDRPANERLDIAFVLDTTGSMTDEHAWLAREIEGIAQVIDGLAPDADTRWSLVVYRDHGDAYVSRAYDFDGDLARFADDVANQGAGGGGDTPEAVERGLEDALELSWRRNGDVARLAFWIADAPHHEPDARRVSDALRDLRDADVHVYPVAASGIDPLAELTMRVGAQVTGGRYLFLTDDSGVGNPHAEPTVPCYFVTTLSDAVTRMVDLELTGTYHEPEAAEVIRTGGDPTDGRCTLDDGAVAVAF